MFRAVCLEFLLLVLLLSLLNSDARDFVVRPAPPTG